jgi:hypothetical protein
MNEKRRKVDDVDKRKLNAINIMKELTFTGVVNKIDE